MTAGVGNEGEGEEGGEATDEEELGGGWPLISRTGLSAQRGLHWAEFDRMAKHVV